MTSTPTRLIRCGLPLLLLALAGCTGQGNDAAPPTSGTAGAPASTAVLDSTVAQTVTAAAPSGDMQALLARLAAPAADASTAAAQFRWDGDGAATIAELGKGFDALVDAKAKSLAQMRMDVVSTDAPTRDATDAEADLRDQQAFGDALKRQQLWLIQAGAPFATLQAEADEIRQHAEAAHAAVDHDLDAALEKIPAVKVSTDGTGCYDATNAERVHALDMRAADRHVAVANAELGEASAWARAMREYAHKAAIFTDTLSADLARIRNPAARRIFAAQVDGSRTGTLGRFFDAYASSVRDFDLAAGRWARARDAKHAKGAARWLCRD